MNVFHVPLNQVALLYAVIEYHHFHGAGINHCFICSIDSNTNIDFDIRKTYFQFVNSDSPK